VATSESAKRIASGWVFPNACSSLVILRTGSASLNLANASRAQHAQHDLFGKPLHTFPDHALEAEIAVAENRTEEFHGIRGKLDIHIALILRQPFAPTNALIALVPTA
jgi:hypothetical protein